MPCDPPVIRTRRPFKPNSIAVSSRPLLGKHHGSGSRQEAVRAQQVLGASYCAVAPDSRTISVHTGVSLATNAANSSGEPGRSSTLSLARLSLASGERRMSLRVALSLVTTGAGRLGG